MPLQKENERITKENNKLHLDLIQIKEERESNETKWKNALRQLQEENKDLKFLIDSKDHRLRKLDQEVTKMKAQIQKNLEKIYSPSQDQIVEGLSQFNEEQTNMIKGHEQNIEMSSLLQKVQFQDGSGAVNHGLHV